MGIQELVLGCRAPSSLLCAALQCSRTRAENSSIVSFKTFWRLEQAVEAFFFCFLRRIVQELQRQMAVDLDACMVFP